MLGWLSYPIDVHLIDKIIFLADVMIGENVIGGGGGGLAIFFAPAIGLLTGPIFFFDRVAVGAPKGWIWTIQLDVDRSERLIEIICCRVQEKSKA